MFAVPYSLFAFAHLCWWVSRQNKNRLLSHISIYISFVVLYPADTTIHFYHLVFPCISTCIIYYFSPVSATNKPLDDLEALHYKKMARKILFSEILFFLLILLIFNTQITFAFFFSFTIHLSVLALQITVELVSKNFFANL